MNSTIKNELIRFGRPQDKPAIISAAPILGQRIVGEHSQNALIVHSMENYELTYLLSGTLEWLINDRLIVQRAHDVLITHPHDKLAILNDSFPKSNAIFTQVNVQQLTLLSEEKHNILTKKLRNIQTRKVSFGSDCSQLFIKLLNEQHKPGYFSEDLCQSWVLEILLKIIHRHESPEKVALGQNISFQKQVLNYLEENITEEITVRDIATKLGYSESHFRSLFAKVSKLSPVQFLRHLRVETAQRLIREDRLSLTDIAFHVGFNSSQYFSNSFKKETGLSPRQYKNALARKGKFKEVIHDQFTTIQVMDMHFSKSK
ncbi:MAG: helix-turn-helix transcriptional regulator [Lentisphaeraceae bacterium]|nr:helix-turn-helix transcriptional regulator [Lentisphaeraceae bacterium]